MLSQLGLDSQLLIGRTFVFRLPQQGGQGVGQPFAFRRLAVGEQSRPPTFVGGVGHALRLVLGRLDLLFKIGDADLVFLRRCFDEWGRDADPGREELRRARLGHPIECVEQTVVVPHRDRVVFVVVALSARHRQSEPRGGGRVDAIEQIDKPLLFRNRAALAVQQVVAIETAGDFLVERGVGQQVARELPQRELVERHVRVDRLNHPVAPDPLPRVAILLESVAVGIPSRIEPRQRHPFAEMRAGHQAVHQALVRLWIVVGDERVNLGGRGRQSDQVDRQAFDQGGSIGLGRRLQAKRLQFGQDEPIDRVLGP